MMMTMSKPAGFDRIDRTLLASQVIRLVAMIQRAPAFRDLDDASKEAMLREGVPHLNWLMVPVDCLVYATLGYLARHPAAYDEPLVEPASPLERFRESPVFKAWCATLRNVPRQGMVQPGVQPYREF